MSWFSKKSVDKNNRKKFIDSLLAKNCRQLAISQMDGNTMRVIFHTSHSEITLTIQLSDEFPMASPMIYTDNNLVHSWLDSKGKVVGCDELNKWNMNHSDLTKIVQNIVNAMIAVPPIPKDSSHVMPTKNLIPININNNSNSNNYNIQNYSNNQNNNNDAKVDHLVGLENMKFTIPDPIPQMNELTNNDLEEMMKDPKLIDEFAYTISQTLREMKQSSQQASLLQAQSNLQAREEIKKIEEQNRQLRDDINGKFEKYTSLRQRQDKVLANYSPQRIQKEFTIAINKVQNECNEMLAKFNKGEIPIATFTKDYSKLRAQYHLLNMKKEKFMFSFGI